MIFKNSRNKLLCLFPIDKQSRGASMRLIALLSSRAHNVDVICKHQAFDKCTFDQYDFMAFKKNMHICNTTIGDVSFDMTCSLQIGEQPTKRPASTPKWFTNWYVS